LFTGFIELENNCTAADGTGHLWNVVYQPLGFLIFLVCAFAECNRTPFDLSEAESELNFGYPKEQGSHLSALRLNI